MYPCRLHALKSSSFPVPADYLSELQQHVSALRTWTTPSGSRPDATGPAPSQDGDAAKVLQLGSDEMVNLELIANPTQTRQPKGRLAEYKRGIADPEASGQAKRKRAKKTQPASGCQPFATQPLPPPFIPHPSSGHPDRRFCSGLQRHNHFQHCHPGIFCHHLRLMVFPLRSISTSINPRQLRLLHSAAMMVICKSQEHCPSRTLRRTQRILFSKQFRVTGVRNIAR